jgi:hypothetical protein
MRTAALVLAGVGLAFASLPAVAQSTTRIETRPFHGATVTIEEGVRVFRPQPSHDRVMINPDCKTPVSFAMHQTTGRPYIYNVADETGPGKQDAAGAYLRSRHIRQIAPQRASSLPK